MAPSGNEMGLSWPNFLDWSARQTSFETFAGWRGLTANLTGIDRPRRLNVRQVTWNLLSALGVKVAVGRDFTAGDDKWGVERTAIVSHAFWQRELGGSADALGRRIMLDESPVTVIGVLPQGFTVAREEDIFLPLGTYADPNNLGVMRRGNHSNLAAIGRLRTGVTVEAATAEIKGIARQLEQEYPRDQQRQRRHRAAAVRNAGQHGAADALRAARRGDDDAVDRVREPRQLDAGSRGRPHAGNGGAPIARRRALADRQADADRKRAAGHRRRHRRRRAGLRRLWRDRRAAAGKSAADPHHHDRLAGARSRPLSLDRHGRAVWIDAGDPGGDRKIDDAAAQRARHRVGAAGTGTRRTLLLAEVALALVLVTGAGLMLRTMGNLAAIDTGFTREQLVTAQFNLPVRYDQAKRQLFLDQALDRLRAIPGVTNAAFGYSIPVAGSNWNSIFIIEGQPVPERSKLPSSAWIPVSPEFFDTMGIRLLKGRFFDSRDAAGAPEAVVVNETFARRFFGDNNPVGTRVKQGWPEDTTPWREIIGVVNDVRMNSLQGDPTLQAYLPVRQVGQRSGAFVVRASTDAAALGPID